MWNRSGAGTKAIKGNYTTPGLLHTISALSGFAGPTLVSLQRLALPRRLSCICCLSFPNTKAEELDQRVWTRIVNNANLEQKPVMLRVLKINTRAIAFYKRLGFVVADGDSMHLQMEKLPK